MEFKVRLATPEIHCFLVHQQRLKKKSNFFLENLQILVHGSSRMKKIRLHTKYEHSSSKESHFMTKFLSVPKPQNCQNFNPS